MGVRRSVKSDRSFLSYRRRLLQLKVNEGFVKCLRVWGLWHGVEPDYADLRYATCTVDIDTGPLISPYGRYHQVSRDRAVFL
jgi:hypothetical protein